MKLGPPTPTGAPDSQFRKMQDQLNSIRNTDVLNIWGWGRGFLFCRWWPHKTVKKKKINIYCSSTTK